MNWNQPFPFMRLLLLLFLFPSLVNAQIWTELDDFPATERDDGVGFVIGTKAYCGTGLTPWWAELGDFHSFDASTEIWTTVASLPDGEERQYATAFTDGVTGFVFGGVAGDDFKNDLWQYDPAQDEWNSSAALLGEGRSGSASFVIGSTAYIIGGRNALSNALNEVWAFDMSNEIWIQKNDFPFGGRWRASAIAANNKGYLIFGLDENGYYQNGLFEYNPANDTWNGISEFPDFGRTHAALQSFGNQLIIFAGVDSLQVAHNDFQRFNLNSFTWEQLNSVPADGRRGGISFVVNNQFYYTTGIESDGDRLRETWKCTNPTSVSELSLENGMGLYPNPAGEFVRIKIQAPDNSTSTVIISDTNGKRFDETKFTGPHTILDITRLPSGMYFLEVFTSNGAILKEKLLIY